MDAGSRMVTGVVAVRKAFADEQPELLKAFMESYEASQAYVNANPDEAGQWIADLGIVAKAGLAARSIPACNIVCITGDEMKAIWGDGYGNRGDRFLAAVRNISLEGV